jgi:hypothetical protein
VITYRQMGAMVSVFVLRESCVRRRNGVKIEVSRMPEDETSQLANESNYCKFPSTSQREHTKGGKGTHMKDERTTAGWSSPYY